MLNWKPLDLIKSPSLKLFLLSVSEINSEIQGLSLIMASYQILILLLISFWLLFVTLLSRAFNSGAGKLYYPEMAPFSESNIDRYL